MDKKKEDSDRSVEEVFFEYGNMLYRIAFVMMGNAFDTECVVRDTLIKYTECRKHFDTEECRKEWLIRVTINLCKKRLRFYRNYPRIEDIHGAVTHMKQVVKCGKDRP